MVSLGETLSCLEYLCGSRRASILDVLCDSSVARVLPMGNQCSWRNILMEDEDLSGYVLCVAHHGTCAW